MVTTVLTLRYIAFALFISFHSVICILAALNLGSLVPNTARFPEVDSYLIFLGALGLVVVFLVIFVELIRKNAFIARVLVEVSWVGLLWIMNLSGAAAVTAISPTMQCNATTQEPNTSCSSTNALLAFTWLSTITLLSYLLGLVICAVHHSQEDAEVWHSGVRDYRWFMQRKPVEIQPKLSYGKLIDPREPSGPPAIYAQQMGLATNYSVEPLKLETFIERPIPPVPVVPSNSRVPSSRRDTRRHPRTVPPSSSSAQSYSLYPQHLQATTGVLPTVPTGAYEHSPPAGLWPRSNPQEPRRKERLPHSSKPNVSDNEPLATTSFQSNPDMAERGETPWPSAGRSRPSGPRTLVDSQRPRPPPLDLSLVRSYSQRER